MSTAAATEVDLAAVDLADGAMWLDGAPYELFALMRREDAVHYSPHLRALFLNRYKSIPVRRAAMSRLREEQRAL